MKALKASLVVRKVMKMVDIEGLDEGILKLEMACLRLQTNHQ